MYEKAESKRRIYLALLGNNKSFFSMSKTVCELCGVRPHSLNFLVPLVHHYFSPESESENVYS